MKVGVLALQGATARHVSMLARLDARPVAVRSPADLDAVDALVLPGGESTTMSMLPSAMPLMAAVISLPERKRLISATLTGHLAKRSTRVW